MRFLLAAVLGTLALVVLGSVVLVAAVLGVRDRPGGVYDWAARTWATILVRAGGVRVVVHGAEHVREDEPQVFVSNHVSWYDVFAVASVLRRVKFVAKAELFRIPIFGPAARAAGTIPIERENRKAAFAAYDVAARQIRRGTSVVVYPEGTRGGDYRLRPFKKGPFVLAIAAGAPIVPLVVHGSIAVQRRESLWVRAGTIHLHFLPAVETAGLTYDDRDRLSDAVRDRMADALHALYGVERPAPPSARPAAAG